MDRWKELANFIIRLTSPVLA